MIFYYEMINKNYDRLISLIEDCNEKKLIVSLLQETRELEKRLGVENEIIFDNSDVMMETIDFEDAIIEINENTDILPSSYRKKCDEYDFNEIKANFNGEYEHIFVIFDDKISYKNKPNTMIIKDTNNNSKKSNSLIKRILEIFKK